MIAEGRCERVGLLATQGIRGGASRRVIERIKQTGDLFLAYSDEPWILEGANVHISFLGYDDGKESIRKLNGLPVASINTNLTSGMDLTKARRLADNAGIAFYADVKGGPFDIDRGVADGLLKARNPDGRDNHDVVRPWINAFDVTRRPRDMWIIDFGIDTPIREAALYEAPFEYVRTFVKPFRDKVRREAYRVRWWLHAEPIPGMRKALEGLPRYLVTPQTAKYRLFVWVDPQVLTDHACVVVARSDDYTLGVLQSRPHELWGLRMGTQLETRPRYTPTTTFETFPFPHATESQRDAITPAAVRLDQLRSGWLNPTGANEEELKNRTLTALYNQRPEWLAQAHRQLDDAVLAAYGWPDTLSDDAILARLLELNLSRKAAEPSPADAVERGSEAAILAE